MRLLALVVATGFLWPLSAFGVQAFLEGNPLSFAAISRARLG
jgi:hypothetical protein